MRSAAGFEVAAVLAVLGSAFVSTGCNVGTGHNPFPMNAAVDLGRKPGAFARSAEEPAGSPLFVPPRESSHRSRLGVLGGAMAFDHGMDLDVAPFVGARWMVPFRGAWEAAPTVKVAFTRSETSETVGGTTQPPSQPPVRGPGPLGFPQPQPPRVETHHEEGIVVIVEAALFRRILASDRDDAPWNASVGAGAGAVFFCGFGDQDEAAPAVSLTGCVERRVSRRASLWFDVQLHAFHTDFGGEDRTWKPAAAMALGLSLDL